MNIIRKKRSALCCLLAFLLFVAHCPTVYAAQDESEEEDKLLAPYFIIYGTEGEASPIEHFPLKATDVTANVNGMIAEIYATQTYANEGDIPINATYVFPTSSDVAVHGMRMTIGDEIITAQIKEKEEAKTEYEEAKTEGKSASLMEQKRPNVFTMDVANIMPGDVISIELHYTQLITPTEGIYEFIFPTVVGPRYVPPTVSGGDSDTSDEDNWVATPYLPDGETPPGEYNITVNLSTGVPIAEITSKSHDISVNQSDASNAQITLADPLDYAGNRDFILKYKLSGEDVQSGLMLTAGEKENFFMLTIQPPERYEPEDITPREYIFVLDISGSMSGYPLDTAKGLIRDLVTSLNETDMFNLILFDNEVTLLARKSLSASEKSVKAATDLIDKLEGGGGTSLLPALEAAIAVPAQEGYARSVVIITDGYVYNDSEIIACISENMGSASFFSFGIGTSVNDYLIKQIAGCGLGESFIVTDEEDAKESAERFRTYIEAPLITDLAIDFEGFKVYDVEPSVPSILYAKQPIVLFGKWDGAPAGTITITGKTGSEDYTEEISVADVTVHLESDALRYLWARTHLDRVAGYGGVRNDESVREEITKLGLEYNMVTPYTSFIAVVETVRNTSGESADVDQALPLPQRVSNLAVGGGYRAYSEPELLLLVLPMAAAVVLHGRKNKRNLQDVAE